MQNAKEASAIWGRLFNCVDNFPASCHKKAARFGRADSGTDYLRWLFLKRRKASSSTSRCHGYTCNSEGCAQAQAAVEQAQGNLERARASLGQAQIDVRRYTPLVAQRAISQAELDKALSSETAGKAGVDANQAVLDNAKLNLGWTTVTSPISGIAGVSKVQIGDLMTPITVMTTISSVNPIYVDFNVAEQDYLRFVREKTGRSAGQDLELILGDGTVYPRRGHALFVNREVDSRTGTIQVRGEFSNPGNVMRPGQYARIRAVTELRKSAVLIPQQAVSELQGVYQVGVVSADNKVTIKTVKLGPQSDDMWVVESGLQAGDNVVIDGLQRIKTGMTVAPTPFKDTQTTAPTGGI